jgi:hypothetical protein
MVLARRSGLGGCRWLALRGIDDGTSFRLSAPDCQSLNFNEVVKFHRRHAANTGLGKMSQASLLFASCRRAPWGVLQ